MENKIINYYSQHFRCISRLLRNATANSVFMYLLDEHLATIRSSSKNAQQVPYHVSLNASAIAQEAGVNRGVVAACLKELQDLRLLKIVDRAGYINIDYLIAIVTLFNSKKDKQSKQEVCNAFKTADKPALIKLGLEQITNGNDLVNNLPGTIEDTTYAIAQNQAECLKVSNVSKSNHIAQNQAECLKVDTVLTFEQFCAPILGIFPTKASFLGAILPTFEHIGAQNQAIEIADFVYGNPDTMTPEEVLKGVLNFAHFSTLGLLTFKQLFDEKCSNLSNRNNIIKEKEKNDCKERSDALVYIGGEEEKEEGFEERGCDDEEPSEEILNTTLKPLKMALIIEQEVKRRRAQEKLQKFSEEEIDFIISDIKNCLDDSGKIFINLFWNILGEIMGDENSQELKEGNTSSQRATISAYKQAIEETVRLISEKRLSPDDEELSVVDEEFNEEKASLIFGWKTIEVEGFQYYKISKTDFYNLKAENLVKVDKPRRGSRRSNPEDIAKREEDFQYMQKINLLSCEDDGWDKLTPVERAVYWFMKKYLTVDDDLAISGVVQDDLGWKGEDWVKSQCVTEWKVDFSHFIQTFFREPPVNFAALSLTPRLFSAQKIRRVNQELKYSSIVDQTNVDDLLK